MYNQVQHGATQAILHLQYHMQCFEVKLD